MKKIIFLSILFLFFSSISYGELKTTLDNSKVLNSIYQTDKTTIYTNISTATKQISMHFSSAPAVGDLIREPLRISSFTIYSVRAFCDVAPVGSSIAFTVTDFLGNNLCNANALYLGDSSKQSDRVDINTTVPQMNGVKVRVTNIGSSVAGSDIEVILTGFWVKQ